MVSVYRMDVEELQHDRWTREKGWQKLWRLLTDSPRQPPRRVDMSSHVLPSRGLSHPCLDCGTQLVVTNAEGEKVCWKKLCHRVLSSCAPPTLGVSSSVACVGERGGGRGEGRWEGGGSFPKGVRSQRHDRWTREKGWQKLWRLREKKKSLRRHVHPSRGLFGRSP